MLYAADGSWNVTVVDGTALVGAYAANGSLNVIPTSGSAPLGSRHASGALNVTLTASNQLSLFAPDGSLYVSVSPYAKGTQRITIVGGSFAAFDPATLFANGEKGFWFDAADITTLFQDSTKTSPITADGQTVGAWADKSGNVYDIKQGTSGARPTYHTDGAHFWVETDGVDDRLFSTSGVMVGWPLGAPTTMAYAAREGAKSSTNQSGLIITVGSNDFHALYRDATNTRLDLTTQSSLNGVASASNNGANGTFPADTDQVNVGIVDQGTQTTRRNGVEVRTSSNTWSTSSAGSPIVQTNNASVFRNTRYYFIIAVNRLLTASEMLGIEKLMATKCGVVL